jgi:hypothetical protein
LCEEDLDHVRGILDGAVLKGTKTSYKRNITHWVNFLKGRSIDDPLVSTMEPWKKEDKVGLIVLYMDYLRSHDTQPNITHCMVALSDHLRKNMTDETIVHNWVIRGAKKSLARNTGRELSLEKEKRFRLPTPFIFMEHILGTYMLQPMG